MNSTIKSFIRNLVSYWRRIASNPEHWKNLFPRLLIVLLIFVTIERILFWITTIPAKSYFEENIFWEFTTTNRLNAFLVILAIVLITGFNRKLLVPWENFDNGNRIKVLLLVVACILSWEYVMYDF